jgi:hypothetical protein
MPSVHRDAGPRCIGELPLTHIRRLSAVLWHLMTVDFPSSVFQLRPVRLGAWLIR